MQVNLRPMGSVDVQDESARIVFKFRVCQMPRAKFLYFSYKKRGLRQLSQYSAQDWDQVQVRLKCYPQLALVVLPYQVPLPVLVLRLVPAHSPDSCLLIMVVYPYLQYNIVFVKKQAENSK